MKIKNLIAATYAPMNQDKSLNVAMIKPYAEYLKKNTVSGAFINGSTGDFASLTTEERMDIVEAWADKKTEDFSLINHVGHTSLKIAMNLASHSADKADAIASLSPYYFKPLSLHSLVDYCGYVADSAPNLPFYYYHIPALSGADFSMIEFLKLASRHIPNLAGIKFTKNDLVDYSYCREYSSGEYNILFGVDEIFLASLSFGAEGWVGSTYNHLAPLYHTIIKAFENGDVQRAIELQNKVLLFVDTLNELGGFNGTAKSFMKVLGVDCGPSRYPHKTLSDKELSETKELFKVMGVLDLMCTPIPV